MKVTPVASPHAVAPHNSNQTASRSKAIAAFNAAGQPSQPVVQNQTAVQPEEMTALTLQNRPNEEVIEAVADTQPIQEETLEVIAPPKEPQETAISRQFAQLARQEKALRQKQLQQEQALNAREQALAVKEAAFQAKPAPLSQDLTQFISKDRIKQDILGVMAETGVSYDDVVAKVLNQQPEDPRVTSTINELKAEIKALKDANEKSQQTQADQQKQAYQTALRQIRSDAKALIDSEPDNYEAIRTTNSLKDVVELIEATFNKDNIVLSVEDAAQQVEDYLVEEATKLANLKKIQQRLQANAKQTAAKPVQQPTGQQPKQPQMKTLTNATSTTRQLSARERALLAFKGELKP